MLWKIQNMEWLKTILEKYKKEEGTYDVNKAIEEVSKEAPNHIVPKGRYNEGSEAKKKLEGDLSERDKTARRT